MSDSSGKEPLDPPYHAPIEPGAATRWQRWSVSFLLILLTINGWLTVRHIDLESRSNREHLFWSICHEGGTPESRREVFLALVADGNAIWTAARLRKLELDKVDLAGSLLPEVILDGSRLRDADLSRADLLRASLKTTDLRGASLHGAQMEEIVALKAKIDDANFYEANLQSASMEQVHAHDANFAKADLSDSYLYMGDFTGASFTAANLTDANLEAAVFRNADLSLAIMDGVRLVDADFSGANWWRAQGLTQAQLDELSAKFAPDEDASADRRDDYQRWVGAK